MSRRVAKNPLSACTRPRPHVHEIRDFINIYRTRSSIGTMPQRDASLMHQEIGESCTWSGRQMKGKKRHWPSADYSVWTSRRTVDTFSRISTARDNPRMRRVSNVRSFSNQGRSIDRSIDRRNDNVITERGRTVQGLSLRESDVDTYSRRDKKARLPERETRRDCPRCRRRI